MSDFEGILEKLADGPLFGDFFRGLLGFLRDNAGLHGNTIDTSRATETAARALDANRDGILTRVEITTYRDADPRGRGVIANPLLEAMGSQDQMTVEAIANASRTRFGNSTPFSIDTITNLLASAHGDNTPRIPTGQAATVRA